MNDNDKELCVHKQEWNFCTRYIIYNEHGSVQFDFVKDGYEARRDVLIWSLWVNEDARRKGIATLLMDKAEELAASHGKRCVYLEWYRGETPSWVCDWYERRGYKSISHNKECTTLRKRLK